MKKVLVAALLIAMTVSALSPLSQVTGVNADEVSQKADSAYIWSTPEKQELARQIDKWYFIWWWSTPEKQELARQIDKWYFIWWWSTPEKQELARQIDKWYFIWWWSTPEKAQLA